MTAAKDRIPRALREQVWLRTAGRRFDVKCPIRWCRNRMTAFDFHVGHNLPESAGGTLHIDNLIAVCARCNLSMGSQFTIDQWQLVVKPRVAKQAKPAKAPKAPKAWWNVLLCRGTPIAPITA